MKLVLVADRLDCAKHLSSLLECPIPSRGREENNRGPKDAIAAAAGLRQANPLRGRLDPH